MFSPGNCFIKLGIMGHWKGSIMITREPLCVLLKLSKVVLNENFLCTIVC